MSRRGRPPHPDILTPREWEILDLLRDGLNNVEIAERLDISRDGVKYHVSQILSKLNVESREEAAAWRPASAQRGRWLIVPLALKAAGATVVAAAVVGTGVLGATVIRSDEDPFVVDPPPGGFPFPTYAPADEPSLSASPVPPLHYGLSGPPLSSGEYVPVDSTRPTSEVLAGRGFESFDGDTANGIRVVGDWQELLEYRSSCPGGADYWKFEKYALFNYGWIPPGALEWDSQQAMVCPDGSVSSITQSVRLGLADLRIDYYIGYRALVYQGSEAYAGEIGGWPAVIGVGSDPRSDDYRIAMAVEFGAIRVHTSGMPLEDALAFTEGISCEYCGPP